MQYANIGDSYLCRWLDYLKEKKRRRGLLENKIVVGIFYFTFSFYTSSSHFIILVLFIPTSAPLITEPLVNWNIYFLSSSSFFHPCNWCYIRLLEIILNFYVKKDSRWYIIHAKQKTFGVVLYKKDDVDIIWL